jgi:hypothetical protein
MKLLHNGILSYMASSIVIRTFVLLGIFGGKLTVHCFYARPSKTCIPLVKIISITKKNDIYELLHFNIFHVI